MIIPGRRRDIGWALVVALWMASPASGQQARQPIQPVKILDIGGKISFSGELYDEKESNPLTGSKLHERGRLFEETAEFKTEGYFYHPNLVDWFANVRFTLDQNPEDVNGESFDRKGRVLDYDLEAFILKEKAVSLRPFARSATNVLHRDFAGMFNLESRAFGIEVFTKGRFPLSVLLQTGKRREEDNTRIEDERSGYLKFTIADRKDPDRLTEFTYEREDVDETATILSVAGAVVNVQDQSFLRDELNLTNNWRFGRETGKNALSGRLRLLDRKSTRLNSSHIPLSRMPSSA